MKLLVMRDDARDDHATLGTLSIDGAFECDTLEDYVREIGGVPVAQWKIGGETAIPRGIYDVIIDRSAHFKRDMIHVLNVPGFEESGCTQETIITTLLVAFFSESAVDSRLSMAAESSLIECRQKSRPLLIEASQSRLKFTRGRNEISERSPRQRVIHATDVCVYRRVCVSDMGSRISRPGRIADIPPMVGGIIMSIITAKVWQKYAEKRIPEDKQ